MALPPSSTPPDPVTTGDVSRPRPLATLAIADFRLFLIGSFLSNVGNHMRTTVVSWEVYERTGAALSLGNVGLVLALPVLLLALPAGVAADKHSRKLLLIGAQVGLAASSLGLAWASATQAPLLWTYLLLFCSGVCRAIGWPASVALVTQLAPPRLFANAATWRSMAFQLSATLGPVCGGFLLATTVPTTVYLIDVVSSLALALCVAIIRPALQERSIGVRSWESLVEGVRFVRNQPLILSTITLDMVAVLFGGATALLPIYAKDILRVGPEGLGWLKAMPSIGAIAMGLFLATFSPIQRAGHALLAAVGLFGAATIVFGVSTSYFLSLAALGVLGAADSISVIVRATLVQLLTPDALRGRVSAINAIFINMSNEIGEFESGVTAHWLGPVLAVAGGGVLTLCTVAAVLLRWPIIKSLGPLEDIRPPQAREPAPELVQRGEVPASGGTH